MIHSANVTHRRGGDYLTRDEARSLTGLRSPDSRQRQQRNGRIVCQVFRNTFMKDSGEKRMLLRNRNDQRSFVITRKNKDAFHRIITN